MKFKKGDKVKVLRMPSNIQGNFPREMIDKIVTISYVDNYIYCVNDNRWSCNFIEEDLDYPKITNWKKVIKDAI